MRAPSGNAAEATTERLLGALADDRFVAIIRCSRAGSATRIAGRVVDAGARVIEISLATPDALQAISRLHSCTDNRPEVIVGAGTVLDGEAARRAAAAGAEFLICPTFNPEVVAAAHELGLAVIPGCATPTEMQTASMLGAAAIKLFTAGLWTPALLRDLLQALPHLRCIPTGGVALAHLGSWLDAGAFAVGLGSALTAGDTVSAVQDVQAAVRDSHANRLIRDASSSVEPGAG